MNSSPVPWNFTAKARARSFGRNGKTTVRHSRWEGRNLLRPHSPTTSSSFSFSVLITQFLSVATCALQVPEPRQRNETTCGA